MRWLFLFVASINLVCSNPLFGRYSGNRPVKSTSTSAERSPGQRSITPRELVEMRNLTGITFSPRGDFVLFQMASAQITTNRERISWWVAPVQGRSRARKVADGGDAVLFYQGVYENFINFDRKFRKWKAVWSPDEKWIYFLAFRDAQIQLWRSSRDGLVQEQLTKGPSDVEEFAVSSDDRRLFYAVGPTRKQIAAAEQAELDEGNVFETTQTLYGVGRTVPINGRLAVGHRESAARMGGVLDAAPRELWIRDLRTGLSHRAAGAEQTEFARLTNPIMLDGHAGARSVKRAPNSTSIAFLEPTAGVGSPDRTRTAQVRSGFQVSWFEGEDQRVVRRCSSVECIGNIEELWWSTDSSDIYFWKDEGLNRRFLYAVSRKNATVRKLLKTEDFLTGWGSEYVTWAPCPIANDIAACIMENAVTPPRVETIDLKSNRRNVLFDANPELRNVQFTETRRIDVEDDYGDLSYGYLVMPSNYERTRRYPLVIANPYECEGFLRGAAGNELPVHVLAANGFAVLCYLRPLENAPTSTGSLNVKFRRATTTTNSLEHVITKLASEGIIDRTRVGIAGLSDGATNTLFAISHSSSYAAASISSTAIDPIAYYLYGSGPIINRMISSGLGLPPPNRAGARSAWQEWSPALRAQQIHTPLLMQEPQSEQTFAMQLFTDLVDLKKPVEAIVYANEYHQKHEPRHKLSVYIRNIDWFNFWLRNVEDSSPEKAAQYLRWRELRKLHEADTEKMGTDRTDASTAADGLLN